MDDFKITQLQDLMREHSAPCVTVYLPTHPAGEQGQQDPVRLKNLLQQAEEQLSAEWMRAPEARKLLRTARGLPEQKGFWKERNLGLAIFISRDFYQTYRLPLTFDEQVFVDRRFHIKPLLPLVSGSEQFFVLALSQNNVRLLSGSRYAMSEVAVPSLPVNMEDALNYAGADRGSQVHSAARGDLGKQAAVFHGQGGRSDTHKDDLAQFFRLVDSALQPVLRGQMKPLLLAGVDYLLPIYREVASYSHIADQELSGNCDYLTPQQVHERAWPLIEPALQRGQQEAAAKYASLASTDKTSDDIRQIVPAARAGRVESLFVDVHRAHWGKFDPQANVVETHDKPHTGDDDLVDLAAAETIARGGVVYAVDGKHVPGGASAAAILRY